MPGLGTPIRGTDSLKAQEAGASGQSRKVESQRSDSNRQPLVYKTRALPLSYVGGQENDNRERGLGQCPNQA